jgi:hypothetical protein
MNKVNLTLNYIGKSVYVILLTYGDATRSTS